jgi:hypothetical protein
VGHQTTRTPVGFDDQERVGDADDRVGVCVCMAGYDDETVPQATVTPDGERQPQLTVWPRALAPERLAFPVPHRRPVIPVAVRVAPAFAH